MNPLVIVQARMGSTRLPGKVLEPIGPYPCLWHVMARVALAGFPFVLTIPQGPEDDVLAAYAASQGWPLSRGPHPDVLAAFYQAWEDTGQQADCFVRVTADCPFVQPAHIRHVMGNAAYVSNAHPLRLVPKGFDVEAFGVSLLVAAHHGAHDPEDRHHVTRWMRRAIYGLGSSADDGEFRVTLDTAEDLALLRDIAAHIDVTPPRPTLADLRRYFTFRPGSPRGT